MREKSEATRHAEKRAEQVEWAIGIASAAIIIAIIGFLIHRGTTTTGGVPSLTVTAEQTADFAATGRLLFSLRNDGTHAASNIIVSAITDEGSGEERRRSVHIDHVSAGSTETGGLYVPPGTTGYEVIVEGYVDP